MAEPQYAHQHQSLPLMVRRKTLELLELRQQRQSYRLRAHIVAPDTAEPPHMLIVKYRDFIRAVRFHKACESKGISTLITRVDNKYMVHLKVEDVVKFTLAPHETMLTPPLTPRPLRLPQPGLATAPRVPVRQTPKLSLVRA